jgi:hypothetical protein
MTLLPLLLAALALLAPTLQADPDDRAELLAACETIPANKTSDGMIFNPPDLQTFYDRSDCLQRAAIKLRAPDLCPRVRERRLPFQDGSGVSTEACYSGVETALAADGAAAEKLLNEPRQELTSVQILPYPNGRDFQILFDYSDGPSGRHKLSLRAARPGGEEQIIKNWTQPTSSGAGQLTHFVSRDLFQAALGEDYVETGFTLTAQWYPDTDPLNWFVHQAVERQAPRSRVSIEVAPGQLVSD